MKNFFKTICILVCLLLVSLPLTTAEATEAINAKAIARTEIWKDINSGASGSAAIAIMDDGKIVYSECFGMADREKSIPVDTNTIFNIGSVSKVYVATAIMLLVDEGKVDLDKPVVKYLPEFSMADERYKDITVRMTLNHTSGLPGTSEANNVGFDFNKDVYKDVLETLAQSHLKHPPGELATYCNDGFTVAEMIVARVSGQSYLDFLISRVFKPLSLNNTGSGVGLRQGSRGVKVAKFYPPGKAFSEPLEVLSVLGAGGLSTSAEDLCRFVDTFSGKSSQILSAKALKEIKKEQPAPFHDKLRNPISWGLGWDVTNFEPYKKNGIKVLGKGGESGTYTAQVYIAPDQRISVAIVSTGSASGAPYIADKVLAAYLTEKGLLKRTTQEVTLPVKAQLIPTELKAFQGYYASGTDLMRIALDMGKGILTAYKVKGNAETPLMSAIYNSGYFYKDGNKLYFAAVDGKCCFVQYVPLFKGDWVDLEKIETVENAQQMAIPMDGQKWLRRNAKAFESTEAVADYLIESRQIEALPGYIDFQGIKKIQSPTFAGMAVKTPRDLSELRLVEKDGRMWAWSAGDLFMPADMADVLASGKTTHVIGGDGYNKWLKVGKDCVLSFESPAKGRVVVIDSDSIVLYDSAVDSGQVFAPTGSFVAVAGNAGDSFKIIVH